MQINSVCLGLNLIAAEAFSGVNHQAVLFLGQPFHAGAGAIGGLNIGFPVVTHKADTLLYRSALIGVCTIQTLNGERVYTSCTLYL